jgi:serine/threonine protein kinase
VFAWKRRFCRNQVGAKEKKEIEILKKLSHHHMVRLAGSYTHRQFLGLLLHPVAICDLHTFFEDFETVCTGKEPKANQQDRLRALRLPYGSPSSCHEAGKRYIFSKIGCITSAIEYLHSQKIQHKDLKPANIVITRDGLWLTDFGSATDFSELTHSNTEGDGHGTERYLAPEIVDYEPSGIAADVFSLGCVLLEICAIACKGTLEPFRFPRTAQHRSGSFQANLHRLEEWFAIFENFDSAKIRHVLCEIRQMLAKDPKRRPKAMASHRTFSSVDHMEPIPDFYLFGSCCENPFMARREHRRELKKLKEDFAKESERKYRSHYKETQKLQKQVVLAEANMSRLGPVNDVTELELREAFYTNC